MKMKNLWSVLLLVCLFVMPSASWAGRAAHFRGVYEILSRVDSAMAPPFFLLDNDTLGVIWSKYANGPLPADLEKYRNEQAIIAGFSDRDLLFFGLEQGALIGPEYMAMRGGEGEQLELRTLPDGTYEMAAVEKGRISRYKLAAPRALP